MKLPDNFKIKDDVNEPEHYTKKRSNDVDCIDAIRSSLSDEAYAGYLKGSVIKYMYRYENKGGVESLKKAQVFLCWLVKFENEVIRR